MGSRAKKKKLIINADDYGHSPLFNKAILELAKKNIITSTSVMMKRNPINPGELKKYKNISVGLHLELKEKDTLQEIENQLQEFISRFKKLPSHLDGHKHTHLTAKNLPSVIKIAKKYHLPVRSYLPEDRKIIKKAKISTPDFFISWHPKRKHKLWEKLKSAKIGTTELVCHPGYYDKKSKSSYNTQRELELKIINSTEFENKIKEYRLISYSGLEHSNIEK